MAREGLTGSRIRERRTMSGMRQADLAREIGISASYLNLIEHNRRRIGGKLLVNIASALGVEPAALSEGAEAALIATLREAAVGNAISEPELDRADEFAGRFPGWAEILAGAHRRVNALERTIETLTDRLAHDPQLAASLHEVLSTAAAIRSTASILAESKDISDEWRDRFHTNIDQDSRRLSDSSKALVGYLDATDGQDGSDLASSPQEEVDAFLIEHGYHFASLESGAQTPESLIEGATQLTSMAGKHIALGILKQMQRDARLVDLGALQQACADVGPDPLQLAHHFNAPASVILRRLATLPDLASGFVACDRAGSLLVRKPIDHFALPRFGAACPLWPMFQAIATPGVFVSHTVQQVGRNNAEFLCYAVAEQTQPAGYNTPPLVQGMMLILPATLNREDRSKQGSGSREGKGGHQDGTQTPLHVGSTCRVCARSACPGRREPSILSEGF